MKKMITDSEARKNQTATIWGTMRSNVKYGDWEVSAANPGKGITSTVAGVPWSLCSYFRKSS